MKAQREKEEAQREKEEAQKAKEEAQKTIERVLKENADLKRCVQEFEGKATSGASS
jgi:hypothetical protein